MSFETIRVVAEGPVGRLVLARPEALNAMSRQMLREIGAAAAWFDGQPAVRAVVVAGEGRAFTAGADVGEIGFGDDGSWAQRRQLAQLGRDCADAIERMRAVTVAALHGHVVGGGVVLAAVCDLRVAAAGTVLVIPEVDLGLPLAWGGIPRLVAQIGPALTKELVMTCRPFSAEEALAWGFVNRVVPAGQLIAEADRFAATIASKPAVPVTVTKEHVNAIARWSAGGEFSFADGDGILAALSSPESQAARAAYLRDVFGDRGRPDEEG